jgi:hypothetical protein
MLFLSRHPVSWLNLVIGVSLATAAIGESLPPASQPATQHFAVPPIPNQRVVEDKLRELFKDEYVNSSSDVVERFASKLLQMATQPQTDPTTEYVLLRDARNLAATAGSVDTTFEADRVLAERFGIPPLSSSPDVISTLAEHVPTGEQSRQLVDRVLLLVDAAMRENNFPGASRLLSSARIAAERSNVATQPKVVETAARERQILEEQYARFGLAKRQLATDPGNTKANTVIGAYFCFVNGDWSKGLPFLAKGGQGPLQSAARADLTASKRPDDEINVADQWYAIAEKEQPHFRAKHILERAAMRYQAAAKNATGIQKLWADRRLSQITNHLVMRSDAVAGYLSTQHELDVSCFVKDWASHEIKIDGAVYAHSLFLHPPSNGESHITYNVTGQEGVFDAKVGLGDDVGTIPTPLTFELVGDGRVLWQSAPVQSSRKLQTCRVPISGS